MLFLPLTLTEMQIFVLWIAFAIAFVASKPSNDWSKPCFHGECAYDLPEAAGSGAIKITGSHKLIKDVSPAAGWIILSCDPQLLTQDIRLVCEDEASENSPCHHLFEHGGPTNKLVRLPESCGRGPFARIAAAAIASEQSIPGHLAKRFQRRGRGLPNVHTLQLDADFEKIDTSRWGNIFFSVSAGDELGVEARSIGKNLTISQGGSTRKGIPERARLHPKTFQLMTTQDQVAQSQSRTVVSNSMICGGKQASLGIELGNRLDGTIYTGFAANGTLAPPKITNLSSFIGLSGNASAHFNILGSLVSTVSKDVELLHQPVKPISIPGILELESSFDVTARMQAVIGLPVSVNLTMNFALDDVQVWYPPRAAENPTKATLSKTSTNIDILNGTNGRVVIDGHIQPKIHLHVTAFSGKSAVDVELGVDMYTKIAIGAQSSPFTSEQPATVPALGSPKTRGVGVDGATSGWAGVKGGIMLSSASKGAFWSSSEMKEGPFLKQEWDISKGAFPPGSKAADTKGTENEYQLPLVGSENELKCPSTAGRQILPIVRSESVL
ncbi:hypothetical protein BDN71DRAFT_1450045 [Pleurotus eryngii]|uniref:Uncharacterized protein n=1 Tax=Pleurotus eryngii TaxID=5323 RepID=A0A9P5ZSR7_PLEER|nr:hypothetical protein BDN71DRAFT_1450045 [Pleurotus eryngii]